MIIHGPTARPASVIWPFALVHDRETQFHTLVVVNIEYGNGGSPCLRATGKHGPDPHEVAIPRLAPRIEQADEVLRQWVSTAQIWTLMKVTSVTAPSAIVRIVRTTVLSGNDVFNAKGGSGSSEIGEMTVLALTAGPFADKLAKGQCHWPSDVRLRTARALA